MYSNVAGGGIDVRFGVFTQITVERGGISTTITDCLKFPWICNISTTSVGGYEESNFELVYSKELKELKLVCKNSAIPVDFFNLYFTGETFDFSNNGTINEFIVPEDISKSLGADNSLIIPKGIYSLDKSIEGKTTILFKVL